MTDIAQLARDALALAEAMPQKPPFEYDSGEMLILPSPSKMRDKVNGRDGWCGEASDDRYGDLFAHSATHYAALAKEVLRLQLILHAAEAQHSAKLRSGPLSAAYVEACLETCAAVVDASTIIRIEQAPPC